LSAPGSISRYTEGTLLVTCFTARVFLMVCKQLKKSAIPAFILYRVFEQF